MNEGLGELRVSQTLFYDIVNLQFIEICVAYLLYGFKNSLKFSI